jgi:hypothetical protein
MNPLERVFSQVLTHWTMGTATSRTLLRGLQDETDFTRLYRKVKSDYFERIQISFPREEPHED